jgi:hypothetical protein
MQPTIVRYAKLSFRELDPDTREDLVQECVANCCCAYARLVERGKQHVAYPVVLANFAVRQIRDGRRVGKSVNVRDVCDEHARVKHGHQIKHIGSPRDQRGGWREQLVENRRTSPDELASFAIDFGDWFQTLSDRDRAVAEDLAVGERTGDVARKYGISAGRVSQLRKQFKRSWQQFTDQSTETASTAFAGSHFYSFFGEHSG